MTTYLENGYSFHKDFFDENEIDLLKTGATYFQGIPEIIGGPMKYFEKSQINGDIILNRIEKFCEYLPLVNNILQGEKIKTFLKKITGREYILFKDKINFKLAGAGGFRPHQDGAAFQKFTNDELVTIMIPVHDSNEENGSLRIKPHVYKKELYPHNNGVIREFDYNDSDWQSINMKPRDILCFSSYLVHQSNDNLSNSPRSCYFITYSPQEAGNQREKYFSFKRKKFPPKIERDINKNYDDWQRTLARKII